RAAARIALGLQDVFFLGNLEAKRDWGHAKDYVEAMWLMLQQDKPEDFVIATGLTTSVREFVNMAFSELGIGLIFKGEKENEVGVVAKCSMEEFQLPVVKVVLRIDPKYRRPTEVELLRGDASKCREKLGWRQRYSLEELVKDM